MNLSPSSIFLAASPIILLIFLLLRTRLSGYQAALLSFAFALFVAWLSFGLTFPVFWISQIKGLSLSLYILWILIPAIFMFNLVKKTRAVDAAIVTLSTFIADKTILKLLIAWQFSGLLEGIAGFGVPIAIVAPILVSLGMGGVEAVAAVAIGHAWSVTMGDMGVVLESLATVTALPKSELIMPVNVVLGATLILGGIVLCWRLGSQQNWKAILLIGLVSAFSQWFFAVIGLAPFASILAGIAGLLTGALLFGRKPARATRPAQNAGWWLPLVGYVVVVIYMSLMMFFPPLTKAIHSLVISYPLPAVKTLAGWQNAAGVTKAFNFIDHPGTALMIGIIWVTAVSALLKLMRHEDVREACKATGRTTIPAGLALILLIGLSSLMDYCGMTQTLALAMSRLGRMTIPVMSPFLGILGAFATGSNTSSNVLLAPMQKQTALALQLNPYWIVAGQTAGGALGSMIAPAKIILGCGMVGILGKEGEVIRRTMPIALFLGGVAGLIVAVACLI